MTVISEGLTSTITLEEFEGQKVAVKRLKENPDNDYPVFYRTFPKKEYQTLTAIGKHPHIVNLLKFADQVLVFEYLQGPTLEQIPPEADKRKILSDIISTLADIHEKGYCHGDLHVDNIILTPDRGPVIIDFGMSGKLTPETQAEDLFDLSVLIKKLVPDFKPEIVKELGRRKIGITARSLIGL